MEVNIKLQREGEKNIANVFVDRQFVVRSSSDQKENAKLHAAKVGLFKSCILVLLTSYI